MASMGAKYKADTLGGKLKAYLRQNTFFCIFIAVTCLGYSQLTTMRYEESARNQQILQSFFEQLEEVHANLADYTSRDYKELLGDIEVGLSSLDEDIAGLEKISIDKTYKRDIGDMGRLYAHYREFAREAIMRYAEDSLGAGHAYEAAHQVYRSMNAEFRGLSSQILKAAGEEMEILRKNRRVFLGMMIFVLFLAMLFQTNSSSKLSDSITKPVEELTRILGEIRVEEQTGKIPFHQLEAPKGEVRLRKEGFLELSVLVGVLNRLLTTIGEQVRTIQEKADLEIRLQQKELENLRISNLLRASEQKAMQMQINPHFLFNTLNMISQTAYVEGADQTSDLLDSTSVLLRYTLESAAREVPLSREVEMLDIYVSILEKRFADRIRFLFDLDERFHGTMVPALIMQPLVENAVNHGVGMYLSGGLVQICTRLLEPSEDMGDRGCISISDNGAGMSKEKLEAVLGEMKRWEAGYEKIGLSNVYGRLQAFFGGKATMEIESAPNKGTVVRMEFPVLLPKGGLG